VERDLGFEVARVLVHPFQSRHQGISHLNVSHKATEMGRSYVLQYVFPLIETFEKETVSRVIFVQDGSMGTVDYLRFFV
jgi:hypothetical protein